MPNTRTDYLLCPDCGNRRVTYREFPGAVGYACDSCSANVYIQRGDHDFLRRLQKDNPHVTVKVMPCPEPD